MGVSTFNEINTAVYNYIGGLLYGSYPTLFPSLNRIIFSVTPDDESCFRRFEESNQSTTKKVDLPAAAVILTGIRNVVKPYGPRYTYTGSNITPEGKFPSGTFAAVELSYKVRIFTETMSQLLEIMELWILFISTQKKIHYHSSILDQEFSVDLVYEVPEFSTLPNVSERWGNRGFIYCMDVSFTGDSILALAPSSSTNVSRIMSIVMTLSTQGKDANILDLTKSFFADRPLDIASEISSGTQI